MKKKSRRAARSRTIRVAGEVARTGEGWSERCPLRKNKEEKYQVGEEDGDEQRNKDDRLISKGMQAMKCGQSVESERGWCEVLLESAQDAEMLRTDTTMVWRKKRRERC
jgi:hypothetical protein